VVRHIRNLNDEPSIGNTVTGTDVDIALSDYDIRYLGCKNHAAKAENGVVTSQQLVRFALCPSKSSSCSSCSSTGGEYVVDMKEFIEPYTKSKLNQEEFICDSIRENCFCNNTNDDILCENQCYLEANIEYCIDYKGSAELEIRHYIECSGMS
jgi:hypothetical protein